MSGAPSLFSDDFQVTEGQQAIEALAVQKAYFEQLFEFAPEAIVIQSNDGRILLANREFGRIFGYDPAAVTGRVLDELIVSHDRRHEAAELTRRVANGGKFKVETVRRRSDGSLVDVAIVAAPVQVNEGQAAVYVLYRDITERKRGEQLQAALYQIASQTGRAEDLPTFYRSIHGIVSDLVYARNFYIALYDEESGILHWPYFVDEKDPSPPAPRGLLRGLTEYVLRTGKSILVTPEKFEELVAAGEVEGIGADCIDWLGVPLVTGERIFGVLAAQSYTEDVRFGTAEEEILTFVSQHVATAIQHIHDEQRLRRSEARYRELFEGAAYGMFRSTPDGRILDANPAMAAMLGYDATELLRLNLERDIYAESNARKSLLHAYHESSHSHIFDVRWKRKDGKVIHVRLTGRTRPSRLKDDFEYEVIAEDVTERHALEEQLRQSQKMEAIGRLAGGIAHDFNNLLTVIKGYSELTLEQLEPGDPLGQQIEEIRRASDRAATLTRQLLAFSRRQVLAPKVLDLNAVIANMERLLRRLLGEDVEFHSNFAADLGRVKADPGQIEQVLMNLAVNAREAMARGGRVLIETANVVLDEAMWRQDAKLNPGNYVMLAVTDTGCGMDDQVKSRVFEPFFTTKERGTGLGLSTVYGIVKQSGGYIWVYSELGKGTTFKVYLPRVDEEPEQHRTRPEVDLVHGTETILLVEDEDGVRMLIRQILQRLGYTVIETRDAGEAILACERAENSIDLLLTDVVLAQMSGTELAVRLAASRPELKAMFISGYTEDAIVRHGVLAPGIAFLQKPFTARALARKLREVLDAR